jgi:hypothetical protein
MATLPIQVQPGDVISSELMNAILDALAQLQGTPGGTQAVPNLFGAFLSEARAIIQQPSRQLALGFTYDVGGAAIDPLAQANANLIVLNQNPPADARVAPGTPVNLVVSLSSVVNPNPGGDPPTISRTETAGGTITSSFAVGGTLVLVGTNFNATGSQNTVTFNNVAAASVTPDPADPTRRLQIVVPAGIPGAPVNGGDPPLSNVSLRVLTPNGTPAVTTVTVTAPMAAQPTISSIAPLTQFEGSNITITGTNFTAAAQVRIRNVVAAIVSTTPTTIVATVPDFPDIIAGPPVAASVVVSITGFGDAAFAGTFRVRGN